MQEKEIFDPLKRSTNIKQLEVDTDYRLYIWAVTEGGRSNEMVIEDKTLVAGSK